MFKKFIFSLLVAVVLCFGIGLAKLQPYTAQAAENLIVASAEEESYSYDCTSERKNSIATIKVGGIVPIKIKFTGSWNKGYEAYGYTFVITINHAPGYIIKSVKFVSAEDKVLTADNFKIPKELTATQTDSCAFTVTGMELGKDYDLDATGSKGKIIGIAVVVEKHVHTEIIKTNYDKNGHWGSCICGGKTAVEPHVWNEGNVTKEPTYNEPGETTYACDCGATKKEVSYLDLSDAKMSFALENALTFNGNAQTQTIVAKYDGQTLVEGTHYTISGNENTNAGNYTLTISGVAGITTGQITLDYVINKATYDMSGVVFADKTVTYDGATHSIEATNLPDGVSVTYDNNGETDAGTYTITASFTGNENYNEIADKTATLTINKAVVTAPTADSTVFTYNGTAQTYNIATNPLYTITNEPQTNADTYKVEATLVDAANYKWSTTDEATLVFDFVINKAVVTVTVENKEVTYGDAKPAYTATYSGFVNGETKGVLGGTLAFACDYEQYANVGNYAIVASGHISNNYAITYVEATLKVNQKEVGLSFGQVAFTYNGSAQLPTATATGLVNGDACVVTVTGAQTNVGAYTATATALSNVNYKLPANVTAMFNIQAKSIAGASVTLDSALTYTGAELTQLVKTVVLDGVTLSGSDYTVTANRGTNAGSYTLTVTGAGNYCGSESKTFTIAKQKVAIPVATTGLVYTGAELTGVATNAVYDVADGAKTNAGAYTAVVTLKDTANYEWEEAFNGEISWSITKATYDMSGVVFADKAVVYNGTAFSIETTNLPAGVSVTYENNGKTDAGVYTITAKFTGNENYNEIADMTATLTIAKATYDMSGVVFADKAVVYNGTAFSIEATNLPDGVSVTYENNGKTDAGVYTITAKFTGNANYNEIADMTATLTIKNASLVFNTNAENETTDDVIISVVDGIDPTKELMVEQVEETEKYAEFIGDNQKVAIAYDIKMLKDGAIVQPDGTLQFKIFIPEELRGKDFSIIHIHNGNETSAIEYQIDGDYVVFESDKLSEFIFVYEKGAALVDTTPSEIDFKLLIIIAIIIALWLGGVVIGLIRENKNEKK